MRLLVCLIILCLSSSAYGQSFDPKRIYQETSKAVVLITAFDHGQKSADTGTGSIIREDGLILTNAHVIFNEKTKRPFNTIRVFLKPDQVTGNIKNDTSRRFRANVIRYSNSLDLALLKIQDSQNFDPLSLLKLSDLSKISIGDPVLAIGHPEQGGLWTLTTGTISSVIENFEGTTGKDVFQTETSINKGNSGGPLIDKNGDMVGINSMIARKGKSGITITDVNFSIKSTVAMKWMRSIGYTHRYANHQQPMVELNEKSNTENAGIIPVPKQNPDPINIDPEPENLPTTEPEILTEVRPYSENDLIEQVEDEMEDLMNEMKESIKSY